MTITNIKKEKIIALDEVNDLIEYLEFDVKKGKATDNTINQLLYAYDIKTKLLNNI